MKLKKSLFVLVTASALVLSACSSSSDSGSAEPASGEVDAKTATSAADFGGLEGLEAACKTEGKLNVIALPPDWANYGKIIEGFVAKYGIKIESQM